MGNLNYGDYYWAVELPSTKEECRKIIQRFLAVGAHVEGGYDTKWKFIMSGKDSISPCICSNHRIVVSIDEAIKRLTVGVKPMTKETKPDDIKADRLIEVYIKMRNKKTVLNRACKDEVGILDEQMLVIAGKLGVMMDDIGSDSFKTSEGTAFKATKDTAGVLDIEDFREFLTFETAGGDADLAAKILYDFPWHFFTKSVSKEAVKQFMKDNDGRAPDGIKYDKFIEVQVRA